MTSHEPHGVSHAPVTAQSRSPLPCPALEVLPLVSVSALPAGGQRAKFASIPVADCAPWLVAGRPQAEQAGDLPTNHTTTTTTAPRGTGAMTPHGHIAEAEKLLVAAHSCGPDQRGMFCLHLANAHANVARVLRDLQVPEVAR